MPSLAQRAEQPLRRAGHADHPGALDVDQRDLVDAGDALDRVRRHRRLADQRARASRARTCCGSRSGSASRPPAPSSAGESPWRRSRPAPSPRGTTSESITVASGTRRGSALSTPSTSVQMWISTASSRSPKIDAEKSLPLRPSVVCRPCGSRAMKPVMISVAAALGADGSAARVGARRRPTARSGRAALHSTSHDVARVDPLHARRAGRGRQEAREEARRPDLAEADDQVARVAEADRVSRTACRMLAMSRQSASSSLDELRRLVRGRTAPVAMSTWRLRTRVEACRRRPPAARPRRPGPAARR